MKRARPVAVTLVTALAALSLGWLARAPYTPPGSEQGLLRLSWRMHGKAEETCRPRTQEELDALPVHMRTPEVCESHPVAYRLVVRIDDDVQDSLRVLPGGARGDRPVFVLRDVPLEPGPHRVRLRFEREARPVDTGPVGAGGDAGAAPLVLDTVLVAAPGSIELITLAADGTAFVVVSGRESGEEPRAAAVPGTRPNLRAGRG